MLADTVDRMSHPTHEDAVDRTEFEEAALAYADQLYRIALRLSGSSQTAEELVQETYLRALRSWQSYRPGTNLAAWLATILRNGSRLIGLPRLPTTPRYWRWVMNSAHIP